MLAENSNVHFDNYLALVKGLCPSVQGLVAFGHDDQIVWRDSATAPELEAMQSRLQDLRGAEHDVLMIALDDDNWVELANLRNAHDEVALTLCFCISAEEKRSPKSVAGLEHTQLLNELLLADYEQCLALASKEDELNHMTDELTRRYHRMFAVQLQQWWDSLRQ